LLKVVLVLFQHPNTQTSHSLKRERETRIACRRSVFVWLVFK